MFEPSYNDLKFKVQKHNYFFIQKHNYFFTNLIAVHPLFSLLTVVPVFCTLHFHIISWQLNLFPWFWLPCICWWYQICISSSELWYDLHISRCLVNFSGCVFACEIPLHHEQANICWILANLFYWITQICSSSSIPWFIKCVYMPKRET